MKLFICLILFCLIAPSLQQKYFLTYDFLNSGDRASNTFWRLGRCFPHSKMTTNNPPIRTGSPSLSTPQLSFESFFKDGTYTKFWCGGSNGQQGFICNYPTLEDCIGDVKLNENCYDFQYTGFSHYCVYDYTPIVNPITKDNVPDLGYTPSKNGPSVMTTYKYVDNIATLFPGCDNNKCDKQVNYVVYTQDPNKTCVPSPATQFDTYYTAETRCVPDEAYGVVPPPVSGPAPAPAPAPGPAPAPAPVSAPAPAPAPTVVPEVRVYKVNCTTATNLWRTFANGVCVDVKTLNSANAALKNTFRANAVATTVAKNYKSLKYNSTTKKISFYPQVGCAGTVAGNLAIAVTTGNTCKSVGTPVVVIEGTRILFYKTTQ